MQRDGRADTLAFGTAADIDAAVPRIVRHLVADNVLAYPTETVYGFGSRLNCVAVDRLLAMKPRGDEKTFLILIANTEMLGALHVQLSAPAAQLAHVFWPGALTLVLALENTAPREWHPAVCGANGTIAVRWTSHPGMQRVIGAYGEPLTSTSANRPGLPPARSVREIVQGWQQNILDGALLALDGGELASSLPSSVVDCSGAVPRLLRSGAIGIEALRAVVPDLVGDA